MRSKFATVSLTVYVALLLFVSWWPYHFLISTGPAATIEWPPFRFLSPEYWYGGKPHLLKILTFVPLGILVALTRDLPGRARLLVGRTIVTAAILNIVLQAGWLFLPGRTVSATDFVLSLIGAVAGVSPVCFPYLSRRTLALLSGGYALCFIAAATWPWRFALSAASAPNLFPRIEWLPFEGHFFAMWALKEAALNSLMTVPLGLLAATHVLQGGARIRHALAVATYLGFGCSTLVEGLQCFLPTRTPSFTDITLNSLGAIAGGALAYYFDRWHCRVIPNNSRSRLPGDL